MYLGDLIAYLEKLEPTLIAPRGFHNPHSYRGDYYDLAFEPMDGPIAAGDLLEIVRSARGQTFEGYKGGDYKMGDYTQTWIANYGETGGGISEMLLDYMFGKYK